MAAAIAEPSHLAGNLKALRLSTVAAQWQPLAEQAVRQQHQTPADYLAQRRERRIQRRIQDARFPMLKTLDAFSCWLTLLGSRRSPTSTATRSCTSLPLRCRGPPTSSSAVWAPGRRICPSPWGWPAASTTTACGS